MSISINDNKLSEESISGVVRAVIKLIPHAESWLTKMLNSVEYNLTFDTEDSVVHTLVKGLHDTSVIYLHALDCYIHPDKLLQLPYNELIKLSNAPSVIEQNEQQRAEWNDFCQKNQIHNAKIWEVVDGLLQGYGLPKGALLCGATTEEVIVFYKAVTEGKEFNDKRYGFKKYKRLLKETVNFAYCRSGSLDGFCNLLRFYLQVNYLFQLQRVEHCVRKTRVEELYDKLALISEPYISCPKVALPISPGNLFSVVQHCVERNKIIGFKDIASAVYNLSCGLKSVEGLSAGEVSRSDREVEDFTVLSKELAAFFQEMQSFILRVPPKEQSLSQTGAYWQYVVEDEHNRAVLRIDKSGEMIFQSFMGNTMLDEVGLDLEALEEL